MSDEPVVKKAKKSSSESCDQSQDRDTIQEKMLMAMPDDFYEFWSFLQEINPSDPDQVIKGLQLGGPYDIIRGKSSTDSTHYLLHHRFFYDSPEFQTVLIGDTTSGYHIGYYRDSPDKLPSFLAASEESKGCKLTILGDNIFAAVYNYLTSSPQRKKQHEKFIMKLKKEMAEKGYSNAKRGPKIKEREKKVVSRGFHGAGIVVPVDENEVGWREVPRSTGELKAMFSSIVKGDGSSDSAEEELQELITYVQFANDECDYGQGLELGNDLFCYGDSALHGYVMSLLPMAYSLLKFEAFKKIIVAHIANREKGVKSYLK